MRYFEADSTLRPVETESVFRCSSCSGPLIKMTFQDLIPEGRRYASREPRFARMYKCTNPVCVRYNTMVMVNDIAPNPN